MKQRYSLLILTIVMVLSACQPAASPSSTPTQISDTATPSITPSPTATETPLPSVTPTLALPVSAGTAFPFKPLALSSNNLHQIEELMKFTIVDTQVFDGAETSTGFVLDTNHGVLITNKKGEIIRVLPSTEDYYCLNNMAQARKDLTVGSDGTIAIVTHDQIEVYSPNGEKLLYSLPLRNDFPYEGITACPQNRYRVRFTPDMKIAAIGYSSSETNVDIYDITTQTLITSLKGVSTPRMFSPDGKYLIVENPYRKISVYQTSDWAYIGVVNRDEYIWELLFSSGNEYIIARPADSNYYPYVYIFNIKDKQRIQIPLTDLDSYYPEIWNNPISERANYIGQDIEKWKYRYAQFSYNYGNQIYFSSQDYAIGFYTVSTIGGNGDIKNQMICMLQFDGQEKCESITSDVRKFIHDSGEVFTAQKNGDSWELQKESMENNSTTPLMTLDDIPPQGVNPERFPLYWFEITSDEKYMIYVMQNPDNSNWTETISARNIETGDVILSKTGSFTRKFIVNPQDSRYVAFWTPSVWNDSLTVWNLQDGKVSFSTSKPHTETGNSFAVSFTPKHEIAYITLKQDTKEKWKTAGTIHFYNYEISEETRSFDVELVHQNIFSMSFSPDGKILALGLTDGMILLLDAETGQLLHSWRGHNGEVDSISFSKDGTKMLTFGGLDYYAKIWGVLP